MKNNNNNKTKSNPEEIRCENCGGNNVEVRVWVNPNVFPVEIAYHDWDDGGMYCVHCRDITTQKWEDE